MVDNQKQTSRPEHITYQDCILGKVGAPTDSRQRAIFQTMMIFCMVHIMVTFNWLVHTESYSWKAFAELLYQYPLSLTIALSVRFLIANPLIDQFVKIAISPYCKGLSKTLSVTLVNVLFMGTITAFISATVVNGGLVNFSWVNYFIALPLSYAGSFFFSFFVVGPFIKKLFEERIKHHLPQRHRRSLA